MTTKRVIENIYPLSPNQKGLLFHALYGPAEGLYLTQTVYELRGGVEVEALRRALQVVMDRHSVLRTAFNWEKRQEPFQVVYRTVNAPWQELDWQDLTAPERQEQLNRFLADERKNGFDLTKPPLLRVTFIRFGPVDFRIVWTHHHLLLDGWSLLLLLREFVACYSARQRELPPTRPFADYIGWLQRQDLAQAEEFWRRMFAGCSVPARLSLGAPPAPAPESAIASGEREAHLDEATSDALRNLARRNGLTLNSLTQGAWAICLGRMSYEPDVVFGTTVSGRPPEMAAFETMVGMFINALPVRISVEPGEPLIPWLHRLQSLHAEMRRFEHTPLVDVQGWSGLPRTQPLFESLVTFQRFGVEGVEGDGGAAALDIRQTLSVERTNYDLTLVIGPGRLLGLRMVFDGGRFETPTIVALLRRLLTLFEGLVADPVRRLGELPFLNAVERHQVYREWNDTAREYRGNDSCLHSLFEDQVKRTPSAPAVLCGGQRLAYDELNRQANRVARFLRRHGVGRGALVGLCVERSLEMVVGLLAVLKAGAAFVPLDPSYPEENLAFLFEDAEVSVVLTQEHLSERLPRTGALAIRLDGDRKAIAREGRSNLGAPCTPDDLAYAIYTSGSTGRPKGARLPHSAVVNRILWMLDRYPLDGADKVLQKTPFSFDVSVSEFFGTLLSGACLVMARPEGHRDMAYLSELIAQEGITQLQVVPSMLEALLAEGRFEERASLRRVFSGGEALSYDLRERFLARSDAELYNLYGPTETAIDVTLHVCGGSDRRGPVPIGRPIGNLQVLVLDRALELLPIGATGQLHIGGVSLGWGYLKRPDLTAERFIPHPCGESPGERLYATGDLVRTLPEGEVDFLGRADSQVKVRGVRVELSEIETALLASEGIKSAVVLSQEGRIGGRELVAHLVPAEGAQVRARDLRSRLRTKLPEHMVPAHFVLHDSLPLTASGKVDRRSLAERQPFAGGERVAYVPPRTPIEEMVAGFLAEVLRLERVGANDNLFDLGGHSLMAMQIVSRLRGTLGVELPLRTVFEAPTVAAMAAGIEAQLVGERDFTPPPLVPVPRDTALPLSFGQERLWFLDQLDPGSSTYNIPLALGLRGRLQVSALAASLGAVIARHEVLRTRFPLTSERPVQEIFEPAASNLALADLKALPGPIRDPEARRIARFTAQRPFDLARGPLLRAALLLLEAERWLVLLTLHHIVADGWSMGVLTREVGAFYGALSRGEEVRLDPLVVQYADFAAWQRDWLAGEVLQRQLAWWRGRLEGAPRLLDLPLDRPRPPVQRFRGGQIAVRYPVGVRDGLVALGRNSGATLFMVVLSGFATLLSRLSGQDDLVVGSVAANRSRIEVEGLIGFFVNTLALRVDLSLDPTFGALVRQVRESALGAYVHQDVPFEKLVEALQPERNLAYSPLFQTALVFQNAPLENLELAAELVLEPFGEDRAEGAKFDLTLSLGEDAQGLGGHLHYNPDLFDPATVVRLIEHLGWLLAAAVERQRERVSRLPILPPAQRHQLIIGWNDITGEPRREGCVHELVERQAERTPDAVALSYGSVLLTYRELSSEADRLARRLRRFGVGLEARVGICMGRSAEAVVAFLAVLKAGGAYVPLDPTYPKERLSFMLADSGARVVITQPEYREMLPRGLHLAVCMLGEWEHGAAESALEAADRPSVSAAHLAYLMYTSGSTGKPKGVAIPHGALNWFLSTLSYVAPRSTDRFAQGATHSFDAATFEIWGALANGGTVVGVPKDVMISPRDLAAELKRHEITVLYLTAALFMQTASQEPAAFGSLRRLLVGGEVVDVPYFRAVERARPEQLLYLYGPTETTVFSTWYDVAEIAEGAQKASIGRPIHEAPHYLLGRDLEPAAQGVFGEAYIGGGGLAREYWMRPDLTAERFVPNPFSGFAAEPGSRIYRSGDFVRHLPDGRMEFRSRVDTQLKIRGFRVEPKEIEAALTRRPGVREALVVAREDAPGDKRLVAYVVAESETPPDPAELRAALASELPDYMVPSAFVRLPALPLTPNGKVDHAALPAPAHAEAADSVIAPRTPTEEILGDLWSEVLRRGQVEIHEDFFALGGHSLLATQVISRLRGVFGVDLPLRELFENPTVSGLAARLDSQRQAGTSMPPLVQLASAARPVELPMSFAQQRMWFITQLEPESAAYNVAIPLVLKGDLAVAVLARSFGEVVRRHEVLRTAYRVVDGRPIQEILPAGSWKFPEIDLRALPTAARRPEVWRLAGAEASRPFELAGSPPLRAGLIYSGPEEYAALFTIHHINCDGWSMGVLIRDLAEIYAAFREGRPSPVPELAVQYADFALWQREWLQGSVLEEQLGYWRRQLGGGPATLQLPLDRPRPAVRSHRGSRLPLRLSAGLSSALNELGRESNATFFMTLLAAFSALLNRYVGQRDVTVGTPISGRHHAGLEAMIGLFANSLALRFDVSARENFFDLLGKTRATALAAYAHQDVPFEKIVEAIQVERDASRTPIFQVVFTWQNAGMERAGFSGIGLEFLDVGSGTAQFDLTLALIPGPGGLFGGFEFNTDLFDQATIQRMSGHFQALLNRLIVTPDRPIGELPLMAEGELHQVLVEWSGSELKLGMALIHEVFELQVDLRPDALAVTTDEQVTFACLEERANRLAHHLQAMGVKPETLVGLCLERSLSMVVAMLGIVKAGGTYVPIDPALPAERVSLILEDTFIPIMVGDEVSLANIPAGGIVQLVALDTDRELLARRSSARPRSGAEPENLAYVMYTSGSTGRPKGVGVTHLGVVRLVRETDYARFGIEEVFLQLAPVSFDASTFEIWGSLLNGSRLVIAGPGPLAIEKVHATASDFGVTTMWLTAGLFHELAGTHGNGFGHVDQLLAGGDVILPDRARSYLAGAPGGRLINGYGPTENTTFSCCHPMTDLEEVGDSVPIGRPVANTRVYVVDSESRVVPAGVEGELFVGGHGLARGYFNQPGWTAEAWVPDAVSGRAGERLYRTGDRVRWRPPGFLEFLGRLDEQVKIRGFRIEPAEVETALMADSEVQAATVVLRQDEPGDKKLVAYVVSAPGRQLTPPRLRESLRQRLPDYMVPSTFVVLEALPLTPNGKVDRRALPTPDAALYGTGGSYAAPRHQVEEVLAAIWGRVLGVERVGIHDNFFDLGGHSLLATRVVSQLRSAFGVEVPLHDLFERPTVAGLSERVEDAIREGAGLIAPPLSEARRGAKPPLSFAQQRLWFIDQFEPGSSLYNMHVALRIEGRLSVTALAASLSRTVERQESLRTIFRVEDGEPVQEILSAGRFAFAVMDLSGLPEGRLREEAKGLGKREARRPFDLSRGPLFRCHLLNLGRAGRVILMTMHHIVSDGWSMRLLVREIGSSYTDLTTGVPSLLPELPVQYADFAAWQRSWLEGEVLQRQLAYWREHIGGVPPLLNLPTDKPRPAVQSFRGSVVAKRSTVALATALRTLSRQEGATPFMAVLSGFAALLGRYAGQSSLCIGVPIAGRNYRELEAIVGFFVNTLALRVEVGADPSFVGLLEQVRAVSLAAHAHQDLPFEKLVAELEPERSMAHSPLFQVMFDLTAASAGSHVPAGLRMIAVDEDVPAVAKFDLSLGVVESAERMIASLEYATDLFERSTAARLLEHLDRLLKGAVETPERPISCLSLLSEVERSQLSWEWNDRGSEVAPGGCLHELFAAQARRTPDVVALVWEGAALSYSELGGRANQVAHRLRAMGVGPESIVGVLMERSPQWLEGVFGALKAGAAYLPLATTLPGERLGLLLRRAGCDVVVTQERFLSQVPAAVHAVCLEGAEVSGASREEPPTLAVEGNMAYAIFTSGSTGRPKGVSIEHRSAAWYAVVAAANYGIDRTSRVLQHAALDFDISIEEIFPALSCGATLVLSTPFMQISVAEFLRRCGELEITHLTMATALWNEVCNEVVERPFSVPPTLRLVCMGGEKIFAEKAAAWQRNVDSRVRLVNSYGPTETTVVATIFEIDSSDAMEEIPIGRPIRDALAYVVDATLQAVPAGVPGELLIGGAGVARGYLNEPAMTAARFVPDPFSGERGKRLYRTGDLVRFLANGNLRYLGRIDDQVKVRGFRVEPGEIETILAAEPGVLDAAVMAEEHRQGTRRLVAYLARDPEVFSLEALRDSLRRQVPDYMVPASFVILDRLPTTANGKLDRRALAQLAPVGGAGDGEDPLAPRTPIEELVASVWGGVLGVERVGAEDNFFALGGHSLLATRVIARLRSAFGLELALRELFEAPTVASFSLRIEAALLTRAGLVAPPLVAGPRDGSLPPSFAQQRLWFLDQLEPESPLYNLPLALRVEGRLSVPALSQAFGEVVRRHEVLRTVFSSSDGVPTQVIREAESSQILPLVDLSGLPVELRESRLRSLAGAESSRPFDLSRGPLLRAWLVRLGVESHAALLTMHHIASDGWSLGILVREVTRLYEGSLSGRLSDLPALPVQYADYARWQRSWLEGEVLAAELAHWREELSGLPVVLELPTDRPRPSVQSFHGAERDMALGRELSEGLDALARARGVTPFMLLLAGYGTVLDRYAGQGEVAVGTPIAGRTHVELEDLIGFFVNTLVLRVRPSSRSSFGDLLTRSRETVLSAYAHQSVPFERLVEELAPERTLSHSPLFQVMLVLQNAPQKRLEVGGLSLSPLASGGSTSKFDLTLALTRSDCGYLGAWEYGADLFDSLFVERLGGHLERLLRAAVDSPELALEELAWLAIAEQAQLLREWNDTSLLPSGLCLHQLFEEQATRHPGAVVLANGHETLAYGDLDGRANCLARYLVRAGVRPGDLVGLCFERSIELVVAVLGVLKAGAAYLPLDPAYPKERLSYLLEDSAVGVVLTAAGSDAALGEGGFRIVRLDEELQEIESESSEALRLSVPPEQPAYVIYTSGSTGRPKGVVVSHGNVVRLFGSTQHWFGFGSEDVWTLFHSYAFDFSVWELWGALLYGGRLVVVPHWVSRSPEAFRALLAKERVTVLNQTPSAFRQLQWVEEPLGGESLSLRLVIFGGEALEVSSLGAWVTRHGDDCPRLINMYGITETTVHVTYRPVTRGDVESSQTSPIGRPIPDLSVHVMIRRGCYELAPIGVPGELQVGGAGLAQGYLRRPELTAERFVPDPFGLTGGGRLYRTGDLVRWRGNGELEFLGRIDHQVKIRGFRIELGEIEVVLSSHAEVRQAVVSLWEGKEGERRLVAYIAAERLTSTELQQYLRERLPEYMVPSMFVALEQLPSLPNGKVDRRALAQLAPMGGAGEGEGHLAPRTPIEELMAGVWADVLGIEQVGAEDNFFALGGHSLLATRVMARLRNAFGVELALRELFEAPTVASFSLRIEAALRSQAGLVMPPLVAGPRDDSVPLSFAQQRLWFLDQLEPESPLYNLPSALRMEGRLSVPALSQAFGEVVRRHEVLRTVFSSSDGVPAQLIREAEILRLPMVDLSGLPPEFRELRALAGAEAARPFDLSRGPLLRAWLVRLGSESHAALLTMHHIVSDGWSLGILVREVTRLYEGALSGRPSDLPALPVQYADYARWQRSWLEGEVLAAELAHWRGELSGLPAVLELPTDRPRPSVQSFRGAERDVALGRELAEGLEALARARGVTPFMVLLAGYATVLDRYAGQGEVTVGTPIAGRTHIELEELIGFFVNTLVLRLRPSSSTSFGGLLSQSRETVLSAYAHQSVPFERLVEELAPERSLSYSPLFQVMLILQNAPQERLEVGGLSLSPLASGGWTSKFDLTLALSRSDRGYQGAWEYNADLFDGLFVERLGGHLEGLLRAATDSPELALEEMAWLATAEQAQLQREWNDTSRPVGGLFLHELFEEQVKRNSGAVALLWGEQEISYGELDRRSNQLAHYLRSRGVLPEDVVGVYLKRAPEMLVAILGILKSGGAYLPIDPGQPAARSSYLLADAKARLQVTDGRLPSTPGWAADNLIDLHAAGSALAAQSPLRPESAGTGGANLAYVIYTSGSTGQPKGAAITHDSVSALVLWALEAFEAEELSGVLASTSLSFDLSIFELFVPLSIGGTVILADNLLELPSLPGQDRVRLVNTVPSVLAELLWQADLPAGVRTVNLAGEPLPRSLVDRLYEQVGVSRVTNLYGPSEDTTYSTKAEVARAERSAPSIGRPIDSRRAYVVDAGLRPMHLGAMGELLLAGAGLARGYLGRPNLTAERFVPDPFSGLFGSRAYRTGDRVRWAPKGELEYLGRMDHQVKIRGFRIELGEIEAVLSSHPGVHQAVVLVREGMDSDRRLVAYVVAGNVGETELRQYLRERLPEYMVPAAFVALPALPTLPSGKVDRTALPKGDPLLPVRSGEQEIPRDRLELILANVWEEVLGGGPVGIRDNFFAIGGHSLLAVRLMARIEKVFGRRPTLATIFQAPTVELLAAALREEGPPLPASSLISIQPLGEKAPFFCVHPAHGNVLCYLDLARRLGTERPFYGFQSRGLEGEVVIESDLEAIAADYLGELLRVQPKGPYHLGGWSMGGVVAYEMAQQLRRRGEEIVLLVLIDSFAPDGVVTREETGELELLATFVQDLGIAFDDGLERELHGLDRDDRLGLILKRADEAQSLPPYFDLALFRRLFSVFERNVLAMARYVARPFAKRVVLFEATERPDLSASPAPAWAGLVGESLEVIPVPGRHHNLLRSPKVEELAEKLKTCLEVESNN